MEVGFSINTVRLKEFGGNLTKNKTDFIAKYNYNQSGLPEILIDN